MGGRKIEVIRDVDVEVQNTKDVLHKLTFGTILYV